MKKILPGTFLAVLVLAVVLAGCGGGGGGGPAPTPSPTSTPTPTPTSTPTEPEMPRPNGWLIGTWEGTMPEKDGSGNPSSFAGTPVRLVVTAQGGTITGMTEGYWYQGQFTWYPGNESGWTIDFVQPGGPNVSYVWWVYSDDIATETFRMEAIKDADNYVKFYTTDLGPAGTIPTELKLFWEVKIGGVAETSTSFMSQVILTKK